jgi:hypothetical protein
MKTSGAVIGRRHGSARPAPAAPAPGPAVPAGAAVVVVHAVGAQLAAAALAPRTGRWNAPLGDQEGVQELAADLHRQAVRPLLVTFGAAQQLHLAERRHWPRAARGLARVTRPSAPGADARLVDLDSGRCRESGAAARPRPAPAAGRRVEALERERVIV